jgi:hypothetical protein
VPFPRTVRCLLSATAGIAAAAALAPGGLLTAASAAVSDPPPPAAASLRACPAATRPGTMACQALIDAIAPNGLAGRRPAAPRRDGFGPASLRAAYRLPGGTAGRGQTVAVIGAFRNPHIRSDLAIYREAWGLQACRRHCFRIINEYGATGPLPALAGRTGWAVQAALDLDVVSAICPRCHLLLVEARSAAVSDLGTAVNTAIAAGAKYVTNGYGGLQSSSDAGWDTQYYKHAGAAVTAAAGDLGGRLLYPAASSWVTAVGGTSLTRAAGPRGWSEQAWGQADGGRGTGAGCATGTAKPSWQNDTGCAGRTGNDVAAVASPATGVAVYDSYDQHGWLEAGGTSVSSAIIAAVYALAGPPQPGSYPAAYPWAHAAAGPGAAGGLFDVTAGAVRSCVRGYLCTAAAGFDGPTGWGTPDTAAAFAAPPSQPSGCQPAQLLANGGFERHGRKPWVTSPYVVMKAANGVPAHSGKRLAWLAGYGTKITQRISQQVTIPAGCTSATLTFWLRVNSTARKAPAADTLTLSAVSPAGRALATLATFSNRDAGQGYQQHTVSLAAYLGQTIALRFTSRERLVGKVTSFFEDGNVLKVS